MQTLLDILRKAGGWHPGLYLKAPISNRRFICLLILSSTQSAGIGACWPHPIRMLVLG
jgi:hypothetical protein